MDRQRLRTAGVVLVVAVAVAVAFGYAYVAGLGPLEEDPTAGLEEPPETDEVHGFGGVAESENGDSETGAERGDGEAETEAETGESEEETGTEDGGSAETDEQEDRRTTSTGGDGNVGEGNGYDDNAYDEEDGDGGTGVHSEPPEREDEADDEEPDGTGTATTHGSDTGVGSMNEDSETDGSDDADGTEPSEGARVHSPDEPDATEATGRAYAVELDDMTECGETCREATVALRNRMNIDAENVVVYTRIYAGDSTHPDDVVWADNYELGTLGAGEVYRTTERVDLTPQQTNNVREAGGTVTARATIESTQATETFVGQDDVE